MNNILYFNTISQSKGVMNYFSLIFLVLTFVGLIIFVFGTIYSMKNTNLSLMEKEVIIKSIFYGRKIPLENIIVDKIKSINLNENVDYNISVRTNGIGLPGFKSGWMKLKNGEKALVYITDTNNVLLLPTKDFIVLFSMNNIEEFIKKIKGIRE